MGNIEHKFPEKPRNTALVNAEEWYQQMLVKKLGKPYKPIKRNNFGEYNMAVNYLTSVMEESKAVNKVAVYNIDHMAQIQFIGKDVCNLLDRVFPTNVSSMKIGQCKYTLLLTEEATVIDDMIIMRVGEKNFIIVINAGHDITDPAKDMVSDADFIKRYLKQGEDVKIKDISGQLVKIDIQGPLSYKLVTQLYGDHVVKNRRKPAKNMRFFTFNEFDYENNHYILSRTGYTNRWGWEMYVPLEVAEQQFKRIAEKALELGGLVVGLGGRDENRISAGEVGLPLNGSEYDLDHIPVNIPLFNAAIDMDKENFVGKSELKKEINSGTDKKMVLFISEGIVVGRGIYKDGKRIGSVTSSITSPNVPQEKREYINSNRKNLKGPDGRAAIGLGWLYHNPFEVDDKGKDILMKNDKPIRINVEFYREDVDGKIKGKPTIGFISGDGVNPVTAPKPLRKIQDL